MGLICNCGNKPLALTRDFYEGKEDLPSRALIETNDVFKKFLSTTAFVYTDLNFFMNKINSFDTEDDIPLEQLADKLHAGTSMFIQLKDKESPTMQLI